jgi:hypothetical protein
MSVEFESSAAVDQGYWLQNCEGFRVEGPAGRLGIVEAVVESGAGLRIARGGLGFRSFTVPADEVESISPHELRIQLRSTSAPASRPARSGHGPLRVLHPLRG